MDQIEADEVEIGEGTFVHPTAAFCGPDGGTARRVVLGDHCYVGEGVQVRCDDFQVGDYARIHHHTNVHGAKPCRIGHNAWIGQYTIIDATGGAQIGDNCGVGAQSQLWSHVKYGDVLDGCRFFGESPLTVGKDVWFVGHCIVSPITALDRSMALAGSVVTRDMAANRVYAGTPAADITEKVGPQFQEVSLAEKLERLKRLIEQSGVDASDIVAVATADEVEDDGRTWFIAETREYVKRGASSEVALMKFLLPGAKFTPR